MVVDIIRDSTFGQIINLVSNGKLLPYADQKPDFVVPSSFSLSLPFVPPNKRNSDIISAYGNETMTGDAQPRPLSEVDVEHRPLSQTPTLIDGEQPRPMSMLTADVEKGAMTPDTRMKRESTIVEQPIEKLPLDPYLVGWYGDDDPENPRNWSSTKRAFVAFNISLLTFSVYIGSAIYTPSIPGLMQDFNISLTHATLGLTLYIIGYGTGPMLLAPLQEMAIFGRNTIYMGTLFLFIIFQIPIITATNIQTVLAFRFLTGFFGSPALATGGASMGDIFPMHQLAYVLGIWALGAVAGPITGPVVGGFAAQANGWKWPQYELIWVSSFAFLFLCSFLPETYEPTILLRRAQRLRKLTGNHQLRSQTEKNSEMASVAMVLRESLIRPFVLAKEPMLMFANIYLGFVYAIFYLWFEAFPLVFTDIYHFTLGTSGLPFLGFLVSGVITYTFYCLYQMYHVAPRYARAAEKGVQIAPEMRLELGLFASIFIPTSVLIFGFTSKESIHWIVPIIGAAIYLPGIYLTFQSILMYITMAYPAYAASVLAGNDLFRSTIASVFPLFGHAFFTNLGLGGGSGLLAGLSFAMMPFYYALMRYGHILRQRSKYAQSQ